MRPTSLFVIIPRLLLSQTTESLIQAGGEIAGDASTTMMTGNFIVNLMLGASLSHLWSMINGLQLSTHLPLFNLKFPSNATFLLRFLVDIANFDILPVETIWFFFDFPEKGSYNLSF